MEQPTNDGVGLLSDLERGRELAKTLTGIRGLDEITCGGLPTGRPTLVCGGPGSGKTLLALAFLVNGATRSPEPAFDYHLVKPVDLDRLARVIDARADA